MIANHIVRRPAGSAPRRARAAGGALAAAIWSVCWSGAAAGEPPAQPATQPAATAPSPEGPRHAWTWLDGCHVLHKAFETPFGTRGSLQAALPLQVLASGGRGEGHWRMGWEYLLTVEQDLWRGGSLIVYGEGGSGRGLDPVIGDILGTDGAAGEPACIYLSRAFLLQDLCGGRVQLIAGKLDLSDFFDTNAVANCEIAQFLPDSLVNNPAIAFPAQGLGAAVRVAPAEWVYFQAGAGDARSPGTTTGFETAFHGGSRAFSIAELGLSPVLCGRKGNYRLLAWQNALAGADGGGRVGMGVSFDQELSGRVTVFARWGHEPAAGAAVRNFWSCGGQLSRPLPGRDDDTVAAAVAQAIPAAGRRAARAAETLFEAYYSAFISDHLRLGPHVQVILNPGGSAGRSPAVVLGFRVVVAF